MIDEVAEIETETAAPANRMAIAVLALIGLLISLYLALHKLGFIGTLACGTGACEVVQTSKWATFMGVPVPFWGVAGYGALTTLALAGLQPRFLDSRPLRLALIVGATAAFVFSVYLSAIEQFLIHAWCRWCIASAVVATLIFLCVWPEIRKAWRTT